MKRFVLWALALIMLIGFGGTALAEQPTAGLGAQTQSYILMDAGSGEVLSEKNADTQRECASVIKSMTLLLVLEAEDSGRLSLGDTVTVSAHAASMGGTQVFLDAHSEHKVEDLVKAVVVCSANDAAVALAEKVAGSEEAFVQMMNKKAGVMGLNAQFKNASGLHAEGQTMSARDIAMVCKALVQHDLLYKWSGVWMDYYVHPGGRETEMVNTNRMVRYFDGCDGVCTGSSDAAGYCVAATAKRSGGRFIYVGLNAPGSSARFDDAAKALDFAFSGFSAKTVVRKGQQLGKNLEVVGGALPNVNVYAADDFAMLVEKGREKDIEKELVLLEEVNAPLKEGDVVGYLRVLLGGEEVGRVDAIVKRNVEALDFANAIRRILMWWLFG